MPVSTKTTFVCDDGSEFENRQDADHHDAFLRFKQFLDDALPNHVFIAADKLDVGSNRQEVFETLWRNRDRIAEILEKSGEVTDLERMSS